MLWRLQFGIIIFRKYFYVENVNRSGYEIGIRSCFSTLRLVVFSINISGPILVGYRFLSVEGSSRPWLNLESSVTRGGLNTSGSKIKSQRDMHVDLEKQKFWFFIFLAISETTSIMKMTINLVFIGIITDMIRY